MALPAILSQRLRLPVVAAPLFIISNPDLVIAQCKAGVVGSFPALNARPEAELDRWLERITTELAEYDAANPDNPSAPFAVNQIVHGSNNRLQHRFAKKAIQKGADGLIAVAAGAGGHAGSLSPFALVQELREWFDGPILLSGSIANGDAVLASQAMGADLAYIGSAFIATTEANAEQPYKQSIVDNNADDIMLSSLFTGVHGNYLKPSIVSAGMDPDNLPESDPSKMDFGSGGNSDAKAWKDIWGCGQGIGAVKAVLTTAQFVDKLESQYNSAKSRLNNI